MGRGFVLAEGESSDAAIIGLTIRNGYSDYEGGGIYLLGSSPLIKNCILRDCSTIFWGGGIYNLGGSPEIADSTFLNNQGGFNGGGIYNDGGHPLIHGCRFTGNDAPDDGGGGIANHFSNATISGCIFVNNSAPTITGFGGGAIQTFGGSVYVTNSTFRNNHTVSIGGAISNIAVDDATILNSLFLANSADSTFLPRGGGAIYNQSSNVTIRNCTLARNSTSKDGGGIYNLLCSPTINSCILWSNFDRTGRSEFAQVFSDSGSPAVSYSCVQRLDTFSGNGNIPNDPQFADHAGRLASGSPCIDAGDPSFSPDVGETDLDGLDRLACDAVDMGAYELQTCPEE